MLKFCSMQNFVITPGVAAHHRTEAAALFLDAFGDKLGAILGRGQRATGLLCDIIDPEFAISAVQEDRLLGVAGFKTDQGAFVGGELTDIQRHFGWFGGLWRGLALSVLERDVEPGCLLMDGIFVSAAARGQGVGTALLDAIADVARADGLKEVRLDVIDTNPRARALYERRGFVAGATSQMGPLRHVFGFKSATTMRLLV